jgi:N-acetylneuraminic acid mutarotase
MALAPTSRKANNVARISAIVIFVFCSVTVACQEILTEKLAFGQETLIKTLLPRKQPSMIVISMRRFALLFVLVFSSALFIVAAKSGAPADSWTTMERMPTARCGLGVAVVNNKIYAIGGVGGIHGNYDNNEEYNPVADAWTTKKPMPTPRGEFAIAVFQDKIYVIGGSIKAGQWTTELTDVTEVYDPATDTWTTKTSMPIPKGGLSASVVDGKIYLIGGFTQSVTHGTLQTSNETLVYDPIADSWTTKKPMPTATVYCATAAVDDKIYVISGTSQAYSDNLLNLTQIYDPNTDTWSQGAPIPTAVQQATAGATTGVEAPKAIYVIGGFTGFYWPMNLTQVYHPETDTWSFGADMPTPLYNLGVAVVKDQLYAIGGNPFYLQPATDQNNQYTPIANGDVPPPSEPFPTTFFAAATVTVAVVGVGLIVYFTKFKKTNRRE